MRLKKPKLQASDIVEGTNWKTLLDQSDKKVIPVSLIKEIRFIQDGETDIVLHMDNLDPETLSLFDDLFDRIEDLVDELDDINDGQIKLIVDLAKFKQLIQSIVGPLLKHLPPRF